MLRRYPRLYSAKPFWFTFLALLFLGLPALSQSPPPPSVLTQHNDNQRTGANLSETTLTPANVNSGTFGKLFTCPVDGFVFAQPLYVPGVGIAGGAHNVLYVATAHDSVYAFDADTGAQLLMTSLGVAVPSSVINTPNIQVEVGIISTPVIDPVTGTLYVVAKTYANQVQQFWLHALDITTLQDKTAPVQIAAQSSGTGYGPGNPTDNDGRHVFFVAAKESQRPALTLVNGVLYIAFASHEDYDDYHGWVLAYNASTLAQTAVYNATPNGKRGGIWMSGQGLTVDAAGSVYLMTGNSSNNSENSAGDLGESFVKLGLSGNTLSVLDYFKAGNYDSLNASDADLGSGGALGIPGTPYLVGGGKQGRMYVVNSANMGQLNTSADKVVQEWQADNGLWGSPVFWNGASPTLYVWSTNDQLKAYPFTNGLFATTPASVSSVPTPGGQGCALSVSANGGAAGTGIVWATSPRTNPDHTTVAGTLYAFDAGNVANELWDSRQNATRDDYGNFAKFCSPTVANGKVYVPTDSGQVAVYGILPPVTSRPPAPTGLTATAGNDLIVLKWTPAATATSYNVYRGTVSGGEVEISTAPSPVTGTTYADTGLTNGTRYFYEVTAVNKIGESGLSNEVGAQPAPGTGTVISLNFVGNDPTPMAATESGGVTAAINWNNAPGYAGSLSFLTDNTGIPTGTAATWTANDPWAIGIADTPGNNRMMNGYLDSTNTSTTAVTVSGLPASFTANGYTVYVYCNGDGTGRSGNYTIGGTTILAIDSSRFSGTFSQASSTAGNYVEFTNLTGANFTLTATPAATGGGFRAPVNGMQIVALPVPQPAITSLSPSSATAGGTGFTLTVNGSGFLTTSALTFGGTALAVTSQTATKLTATVPASAIAAAGPVTVSVTNPAPGGGTASATFTVNPVATTTALISSLNPSLTGQSVTFTATVTGASPTGTVQFAVDGSPAGSPTALTGGQAAYATSGLTAGSHSITASYGGDGANAASAAGTLTQTVNAPNPAPTVASLSPAAAVAGSAGFTLTVNGTNFLAGTMVAFGGDTALTPTLVSATTLTVPVPAADIATAGPVTVSVTNPAPGGGAATANFTVTSPAPVTVLQINAGGGAVKTFAADKDYAGGTPYGTAAAISTAGVANAAPSSVYQTERYGNCTYTLPGLTPGGAYTLRLHFAEIYWNAAGKRLFNVRVNGAQVLTNFDIYKTAGGVNRAVVQSFPATADGTGKVTVQFVTVRDNAKLSAIELLH